MPPKIWITSSIMCKFDLMPSNQLAEVRCTPAPRARILLNLAWEAELMKG